MTTAIETFTSAWDTAFNAGDFASLARTYAKTGRAIPAGGAPVEGQDTIAAFFADVRSKGLTKHQITIQSLTERGDTAIATGRWQLSGASRTEKFGGNWVNVLERDGDSWKILLHTWN